MKILSTSNESYGWHFQYLTIIGLAIGVVTFTLGIVADLTQDARVFQWKNTLSVCVTPLEVLISFLYWGLRTVSWGVFFLVQRKFIYFFPRRGLDE